MDGIYALGGFIAGAGAVYAGVRLGYRIGYQARTGDTAPPLDPQTYEGEILDAFIYPGSVDGDNEPGEGAPAPL